MPTLQVGGKEIPYEVRRSATGSERRVTVTPGRVEVLALRADGDEEIELFLNRKRQWIFNSVREMDRVSCGLHSLPRFKTGSKIPYRGRKMPLTVRRTDGQNIEVSYRSGFVVELPSWVPTESDQMVAQELKLWLKRQARRELPACATRLAQRHRLRPASVRVADFRHGWGSCGPKGNIVLNWTLIFAPPRVAEYVVAHELTHLQHRSHGKAFWTALRKICPNFESGQGWLAKNESFLDAQFLSIRQF